MKKNMFKVLGLAFAMCISILFISTAVPLQANTTQLASPAWGQGKPVANTTTKMGVQFQANSGISDCSLGAASASVVSGTSTALNVTSIAGLSPSATTPYSGGFKVFVVNTGSSTLVVYASMSATSQASGTPSGIHVLAGQSTFLDVASRDGVTVHLQGLTATSSANTNICNY